MSVCLNIPNLTFRFIHYDFPKQIFGMLLSDLFQITSRKPTADDVIRKVMLFTYLEIVD